jgi:Carboxypeptidase regulatory-like domain
MENEDDADSQSSCTPQESPMTKSPAGVRLTPSAYVIARLVATCASLVFAAACDGRSSPTVPDSPLQLRILGMVTDEVRRALSGATIRVLDGPMAGTPTATTDASGRFELYSTTPGTVTLQVNRPGFTSAIHTTRWQAADNGAIELIRLESQEKPAIQLDPGDYTVTISMDSAAARDLGPLPPCAGFPSEMMSRTYEATIAESSHSSFDKAVSLEGPTVFSNVFGVLIGTQSIGFELESPFTEELSGFRYLNVIGYAPTGEPVTVSGPAVSIPFSALFQYCELNAPARRGWENCQHAATVRFHACASDSARMVFTRR